jgi:hypothetical protein
VKEIDLPQGWYWDASGQPRKPDGSVAETVWSDRTWELVGPLLNELAADGVLPTLTDARAVLDAVEGCLRV